VLCAIAASCATIVKFSAHRPMPRRCRLATTLFEKILRLRLHITKCAVELLGPPRKRAACPQLRAARGNPATRVVNTFGKLAPT
jgi:hypothetical protein